MSSNVAERDPHEPFQIPIIPLKGMVVFPHTTVPLNVGQQRTISLIDDAVQNERMIGLFTARNPKITEPDPSQIHPIGTLASIHRLLRANDGTLRLLINSQSRLRVIKYVQTDPYLVATVQEIPEVALSSPRIDTQALEIIRSFTQIVEHAPSIPGDLLISSFDAEKPLQIVYSIANYLNLDVASSQTLLGMNDVSHMMIWLQTQLNKELDAFKFGEKIKGEANRKLEKAQHEFFLRQQIKAIQEELGETDERNVEIQEFRTKIKQSGMPEEAEEEAERELSRLAKLPQNSNEYSVTRTYLEWATSLPWQIASETSEDIQAAREILNADHFGLDEVKERIIEYIAVRKLRNQRGLDNNSDRKGAILCLAGPPGVGKTSLGESIARSMGREYVRISLGGIRDEAQIRGHRRTYVAAMPGQIIQALRRAGSNNPVMVLDELDKLGSDFRGDPASALLEVLDPVQNKSYRDHYLDVPFDLSSVVFIATVNDLGSIPTALRDRLEIIQLSGYTNEEKTRIAKRYLIPRAIRENGLGIQEAKFTNRAIHALIAEYTREPGVRELERKVGTMCRKVATKIAENNIDAASINVDVNTVIEFLGVSEYEPHGLSRLAIPGIATGLSWTPVGGEVLFIEASLMPGTGKLTLTGQLGDVMQESAQTALSYIRANWGKDVSADFYYNNDIHIHVPAGSISKEGPSAGITIATALASLLSGTIVNQTIGMTGELTLSGQVLPIGGFKEKCLAAHRSGLKTVIAPEGNRKNLAQLPDELQDSLVFIFVSHVEDVFTAVLADKPLASQINDAEVQHRA